MATLNWIGKEAVVNHHKKVPVRLLECDRELSAGDPDSGNLLVEGDNLEALKALLPRYKGQVKCIYIDPPYNTGNEGWVYNDNVNDPRIMKWLGDAVGKEAEDLCRHDKWLCMMYPRVALLREFLREDGLLFVSLDDNEVAVFKCVLDELFGRRNFVQQIIWKNKYGPGAMTRGFGNIHEYILCYSKSPVDSIEAHLSAEQMALYKHKDEHFATRGGYITQPLATKSKDNRANLVYPIAYKSELIWPDKQWIWEQSRMKATIAKNGVVFKKMRDGGWSVRFKQYLRDENGNMRMAKPISIMNGPFNQDGTAEIEEIFGDRVFNNPKPTELIRYLLSMVVNDHDDKDAIFMDSFAGSGTTGHAVLALNRQDGGNRRFILVQMEESGRNVARDVTAVRLKRVIEGYHPGNDAKKPKVAGLGAGFKYCRLGREVLDEHGNINPEVPFVDLARYVFLLETGVPAPTRPRRDNPLIGVHDGRAVYLLYNGVLGDRRPAGGNILTRAVLDALPAHPAGSGERVVYGEGHKLSEATMKKLGITFRQTPYSLHREG